MLIDASCFVRFARTFPWLRFFSQHLVNSYEFSLRQMTYIHTEVSAQVTILLSNGKTIVIVTHCFRKAGGREHEAVRNLMDPATYKNIF